MARGRIVGIVGASRLERRDVFAAKRGRKAGATLRVFRRMIDAT
jgi:hypothetical protein